VTAPDCPHPASCPVPDPTSVRRSRLRSIVLPAGSTWVMVARRDRWPSLFNPSGAGASRFAPVIPDDTPVPTAYFAATKTVALLETVLHSLGASPAPAIQRHVHLAPWLTIVVTMPSDVRLVDLGDDALDRLGLGRHQLVATTTDHYRCTREWATALHGQVIGGQPTHGLLWHSRLVEVGGATSSVLGEVRSEVCMLFGDALPTDAGAWAAEIHDDDLTAGTGLAHVDEIVTLLGGTIT
jgi:hypothetical protein